MASTASASASTLSSSQRIGPASLGAQPNRSRRRSNTDVPPLGSDGRLADLVELAQQLPLALAELGRHHDVDDHVEVAAARAAQARNAQAAQADLVAGLGARPGRRPPRSPSTVGTVSVAPRAACGKVIGSSWYSSVPRRTSCGCGRIVTATYRSPFGPPRGPGLALALERDALAVVDPGRDRDLERSLLADAPVAVARGARRGDDPSLAVAALAGHDVHHLAQDRLRHAPLLARCRCTRGRSRARCRARRRRRRIGHRSPASGS